MQVHYGRAIIHEFVGYGWLKNCPRLFVCAQQQHAVAKRKVCSYSFPSLYGIQVFCNPTVEPIGYRQFQNTHFQIFSTQRHVSSSVTHPSPKNWAWSLQAQTGWNYVPPILCLWERYLHTEWCSGILL